MKFSSEEKRMELFKSEKDRLSPILANNHRCESQIAWKKNRAKLSCCITEKEKKKMIDFNLYQLILLLPYQPVDQTERRYGEQMPVYTARLAWFICVQQASVHLRHMTLRLCSIRRLDIQGEMQFETLSLPLHFSSYLSEEKRILTAIWNISLALLDIN